MKKNYKCYNVPLEVWMGIEKRAVEQARKTGRLVTVPQIISKLLNRYASKKQKDETGHGSPTASL